MSRRRVQLVILCEDIQHRAFAKGLFEARGFRNIRFLPIPEGKGAATQYIFERYPNRVKAYRILAHRNYSCHALAVFIDADNRTIENRLKELDEKLEQNDLEKRQNKDKIALFVPKMNIETWSMYLMEGVVDGKRINEETSYKDDYKRLYRVRDCIAYAKTLANEICPSNRLPFDAPSSLHQACDEIKRTL
ncbi:MAG: hypothetical protein DRR16_06740 [Candidatus Parabeggiatoa sp. nov. 3]|nr:MAG: hypothetical protein DRR00_31150 [Gammaproteobacteria bacterium]RKZ55798.1 MAG: hypothetical protein DRQ99_29505 [Gammaproteobacteria bacterium]RKZ87689.1 MAG: hypothetical protein DRR16_06740 [Gammaproteobacteria bacterium]